MTTQGIAFQPPPGSADSFRKDAFTSTQEELTLRVPPTQYPPPQLTSGTNPPSVSGPTSSVPSSSQTYSKPHHSSDWVRWSEARNDPVLNRKYRADHRGHKYREEHEQTAHKPYAPQVCRKCKQPLRGHPQDHGYKYCAATETLPLEEWRVVKEMEWQQKQQNKKSK